MSESMSVERYRELLAQQAPGKGSKSSGKMLRLPASFLEDRNKALTKSQVAGSPGPVPAETKPKVSSAAKARDRVASTVAALEEARVEVDYELLDGGRERAVIRVHGGETLPPNRAANIGREQGKASQRAFSRYKHACADRMGDAAMLLRVAVAKAGGSRFNRGCAIAHISYVRQVCAKNRFLDEDAVVYSFKYVLDGLVGVGILVDDSRQYVRVVGADQVVGSQSLLVIEIETQRSEA